MSSVRPLLRIARRDALRAKGRSTLIALMILLPVFVMTFTDVLARTAQADPDEQVTRRLGQTQYVLEATAPIGAHFMQAPDPDAGSGYGGDGDGTQSTYADPADFVPAGARTLTAASSQVQVRTGRGVGSVGWNEVDAADPAFAGRFRVVSGRAPARSAEVLLTPELLDRTRLELGDTLHVTAPAADLTVVGTVRQLGVIGSDEVFAMPGTLVGAPHGIAADQATTTLYVHDTASLPWSRVLELNKQGISVYDRSIVLHPPARADVPFYADQTGWSSGGDFLYFIMVGAVVGGLAALEVVLLAGAAFAVGARRQARSLALLAASGGSSRHVRLVVLSGGLVLGTVAAVAGVAGGILAAALARPLLVHYAHQPFARFDVRPLELLAIAVLGVVTGVLAAVVPARTAARQDVVAALGGRRGQVSTRLRVPLLGVVMTAAGVVAATVGSLWTAALQGSDSAVSATQTYLVAALIAGGAGLAVVGLVVLSPAIMGLVGRLGRYLPLAARLAVRDAARHRGRSAPAMAAVLAAVSGSAALLLYVAALDDHDRRDYLPSLPYGTAGVSLQDYVSDGPRDSTPTLVYRDPAVVGRAVRSTLPVTGMTVLRSASNDCTNEAACRNVQLAIPPANRCPTWDLTREPTADERAASRDDWRCQGTSASGIYGTQYVVGGAAELAILAGHTSDEALQALDQGGAVVLSRQLIGGRSVSFEVYEPGSDQPPAGADASWTPTPDDTVTVPATYLEPKQPAQVTVLSPAVAKRLGLQVHPFYALLSLDRLPTQDEEDAARQAVQSSGVQGYFEVERGYVSAYGLGLLALVLGAAVITLGAAGIATGLAQADARADHATLAAVGAAPRLRRNLAAYQSLTIAGLGTALGIAVGFVPAVAIIGAVASLQLVLPWLPLAAMLVGVPLLAAAAAWLFTRSRLPLERRLAA